MLGDLFMRSVMQKATDEVIRTLLPNVPMFGGIRSNSGTYM